MLLRLLALATFALLCLAGFLPGPLGPDGTGARGRIGERQGTLRTSRHIKASLQPRMVNVTRSPTVAATNGTFRITPRWGEEDLYAFGAGIVYMLELEIGTPGQGVSVILDTGSYTLLVNPDCIRAADENACETYGHYDTGKSATAQYLNSYFVAQFGTGYMEGVWYSETVYIGQDSLPLPNSRVGVNTWSDYLWAGVLGVSYGHAWNTGYPTLLDLLVSEGYIEVPIFSLGVGYQDGGSSSNIIFGGVDRRKYRGYLEPVEIYPKPSTQIELYDQVGYWVNLTSLGITPPGQEEETLTNSDFERMMLIDSGSTYTYIDADLVATVAKALNAYIDDRGVYFVPCESRELDGYVNFGFNYGNMIIRASYADFIVDFDDYCALGLQPADAGVATWVLGNSFIRAAYIVFDQQNDAIWLAQYSPCGDNGISDLTLDAGRELWLDMTGLC
ncbi:aspartic peptidase domain-containing protein [Biscogniauxia sp. FL1348]|nr:aspartic peptidase domain-containing protein [Biscogniauxia sp. FL1348]